MPSLVSVLFVDDEPRVLDGLRRMLRGMRNEWKMTFVTSGEQALEELATNHYDIVVSDMRMPGMDGATLLTEVWKRYPEVSRVVLSGQADREMILRSIEATHQYLSKPCEPERLIATISQCLAHSRLLVSESIRKVISQIGVLQTMPEVYEQLRRELQRDGGSMHAIGDLVQRDVGLTAYILRVANSGYFAAGRPVTSPERAVGLLGVETVKSMVLTLGVYREIEKASVPKHRLLAVMQHSTEVATLARGFARREGAAVGDQQDAFTAGLLHDIGVLLLEIYFPSVTSGIWEGVRSGKTRSAAERDLLGVTHGEVGAYLLGSWGMPSDIVEATAFHHEPSAAASASKNVLLFVHVADSLVGPELANSQVESTLDIEYITRLELGDRIPEWKMTAKAFLEEGNTVAY